MSQNEMGDNFERANGTYEFDGTNSTMWTKIKPQTETEVNFDTANGTYELDGTSGTTCDTKKSQTLTRRGG